MNSNSQEYQIWFRTYATARKVTVWTIWANSIEEARDYAERHLNDEYYGEAVLHDVCKS